MTVSQITTDFGDHVAYKFRPLNDGVQYRFKFENGYGASVIRGPYSYGGDAGLWEVAVLHNGGLCYTTPITEDVLGYLDEQMVADTLDAIAALPAEQVTA